MVKRSRLDSKVALVTGGARGIGRAIALQLAEDGADVAINYQYTKEQAEQVSKLIDQIGIWELHNRPGNRYKRRTLHLK